jgi:glutamate-1-semialdehyde-2,1-aminomutase
MKKLEITKSLELWEKAKELMPRGTQTMSKAPDQFVLGVHPIYLERGKGCKVQDVDGNWYIDYPCALGPIILGYDHKRTIDAIAKQAKKGITFSLMSPLEVELAELLTGIIPCAEQVRYAKNGTDATLAAVRLARAHTGKEKIAKADGHYHGWGDWHAASTVRDYGIPKVLKDYVKTFKYNDLESLRVLLETETDIAGVIIEPVSLDAPAPGFLEGVRELCTKHKVVLIFDETITGFRWALGGAQEHYKVVPDIATFGKAIANGMPLAVIAGKKEFMKQFDFIFFSMTFGGEACSLAAAIETVKELKELKDEIYPHIWRTGNRLATAFNDCVAELGLKGEMFGCDPRHNIRFTEEDASGCRDLFHQEVVKRGVLMGTQIYTGWAHKDEHIEKTVKAMQASLKVVKRALKKGSIDQFLEGQRSVAIFKKAVS